MADDMDQIPDMTQGELVRLLDRLTAAWESEVVEFKDANDNFSTDKIGKYVSALSNEANLRGAEAGWLVFGVHDKSRTVIGTDYRLDPAHLDSLKRQIEQGAEPSLTVRDLHVLDYGGKRVILMQIPPAPRGIPIGWQGHYYARAGESLVSLALDKQDEIRRQTVNTDWTAVVVPEATIDDLDPDALAKAREAFAAKYATRIPAEDVMAWPTAVFTDRARLTKDGAITRAALLLLGRRESAALLSPHMAQITWNLVGPEEGYEHFAPPWFLATTELYQRIRNVQIRLLPPDELIAVEISKYEQPTVLEALHNCIAHQDYTQNSRIVVTEKLDRLVFRSQGSFFEGQPEEYAQNSRVPSRYRNPFLVQAMAEINMIDTMGYGIHRMTNRQARRYLPLPDYDLTNPSEVSVTIYGGVVDQAYSQTLMRHTDLPLGDILALDRVQKGLPIPSEASRRLRRAGLIEGRKPHLHVTAVVAKATDKKIEYMRTRAQDDTHYMKLVTDYLERFGTATRRDVDDLLLDKLSDALSDRQKTVKVTNLLQRMRKEGVIVSEGPRRTAVWRLVAPRM
jgi:ATP-dependent DNA helicase RecG